MNTAQFRALYRQFLFRVFDLEVLSPQAQGDANRLLGQFGALLIFISVTLTFGAILDLSLRRAYDDPRDSVLVFAMIAQHFLIATTMLVVGLFAVLSWEATFPDRRDVLVLAPLPVRARTIFLAKVAAGSIGAGLDHRSAAQRDGSGLPMMFVAKASPAVLPALAFDPTPVPVAAAHLQAVLDRDLRQALTSGDLAPGTGVGARDRNLEWGQWRVSHLWSSATGFPVRNWLHL